MVRTIILSDKLTASLEFYYDKKGIVYIGDIMVGIYVRVSTEEQALNGYSIRAQIDKLTSYCKLKDWIVKDIYVDDGISGKNIKDRNELLRLIEDIKNKKIDNVLVYKIDRLTRSTKDLIELVDFFNSNNCSFNSFTENIDSLSSTGRLFIKIIGTFAEFERENISERVKLGLERKVKEGYSIASKIISYGYYKDKNTKLLCVNQYEAYVVRKIFNMFLYGYSYTGIANYLNRYRVKRCNGRWNYKNVKLILSNPNYIGLVRHGINTSDYFENVGKHIPIISSDVYYKVRSIIKNNCPLYCECGGRVLKKKSYYFLRKGKKRKKYIKYYCSKCNCTIKTKSVKHNM